MLSWKGKKKTNKKDVTFENPLFRHKKLEIEMIQNSSKYFLIIYFTSTSSRSDKNQYETNKKAFSQINNSRLFSILPLRRSKSSTI